MITDTVAATAEHTAALPQAESRGITRLRLWGPLTAPSVSAARGLLRHSAGTAGATLLVDLRAVTAIDVCGVAALLDSVRAAEEIGAAVELEVNEVVVRALKASGTITAFRLADEAVR